MTAASGAAADEARVGFDLLLDFWESFRGLRVRDVDPRRLSVRDVEAVVRQSMFDALHGSAAPVALHEIERIRSICSSLVAPDEFCITLDHRTYFEDADVEFDQTRVATTYDRRSRRALKRQPRVDREDLPHQAVRAAKAFKASGKARVVLADDGIGSGETMQTALAACHHAGLSPTQIFVGCNNTLIDSIGGVAITSAVKRTIGRPWLNERDLYWGLPRSGQPIADVAGAAVPFSIDEAGVFNRIEVEERVGEFRQACLRANIELWRLLERSAGHALYCEDCPELAFVPAIFERRRERVIELLELLAGDRVSLSYASAIKGA